MTRIPRYAAVLCLTFAAVTASAAPAGKSELRKAIQARYDGYMAAVKSLVADKAPDRYRSILAENVTPDFVWLGLRKGEKADQKGIATWWTAFFKRCKSIES